jgi:N6-L-threonylcarbamoyladenine synthase
MASAYPYLMLLVSGGHCQFLRSTAPTPLPAWAAPSTTPRARPLTRSPSFWACRSPAAPRSRRRRAAGDPRRFALPRPLLDRPGCDLSFSGLKTAVLRQRDELVAAQGGLHEQDRADLCAGFQAAVADVLAEKTRRALARPAPRCWPSPGASPPTRPCARRWRRVARGRRPFLAPPLRLCTDNAAMIAWAGIEAYNAGQRDGMDLAARPRWPLDQNAAPMLGAGKKGAKA